MRALPLVLFLIGCSSMNIWTLVGEASVGKMYMQKGSLEVNGNLATVWVRQEYAQPVTTEIVSVKHWSTNLLVRIRCDEQTWTTMEVEAFDLDGQILVKKVFDGSTYYPIPKQARIHQVTEAICANAIKGEPIYVQTLG